MNRESSERVARQFLASQQGIVRDIEQLRRVMNEIISEDATDVPAYEQKARDICRRLQINIAELMDMLPDAKENARQISLALGGQGSDDPEETMMYLEHFAHELRNLAG